MADTAIKKRLFTHGGDKERKQGKNTTAHYNSLVRVRRHYSAAHYSSPLQQPAAIYIVIADCIYGIPNFCVTCVDKNHIMLQVYNEA